MNVTDMPSQDSNAAEFTTGATDYALNLLATENTTDLGIENDINDPVLDAELAELEAAIAAIPYSTPSIPLSPDLKTRLFERIAETSSPQGQSKLFQLFEHSIDNLKKKLEGLEWQPLPGMKNGAMATYQIDHPSRSIAFFVRATTAETFPNHYHAEGEDVLVLEGNFVVGDQVYGRGDRIFSPAKTSHQPSTTQGCLIFCVSSIDDKML